MKHFENFKEININKMIKYREKYILKTFINL